MERENQNDLRSTLWKKKAKESTWVASDRNNLGTICFEFLSKDAGESNIRSL
jgi:hypothetical protein